MSRVRSDLSLVASIISLVLLPQGAEAEHFKFWMKAFIPNMGLDIVRQVPNSPDLSMIPGPSVAGIPVDSYCYNTNNRSFSSKPDADAKISLSAEFDILSPGIANLERGVPDIGETIRYDCLSGNELKKGRASSNDVIISDPTWNAGTARFQIDAEASNPLVNMSPSIKLHGLLAIDSSSHSIRFSGTIARFPSYEAYLSVDGADPIVLFQASPDRDASPWSLIFNRVLDVSIPY